MKITIRRTDQLEDINIDVDLNSVYSIEMPLLALSLTKIRDDHGNFSAEETAILTRLMEVFCPAYYSLDQRMDMYWALVEDEIPVPLALTALGLGRRPAPHISTAQPPSGPELFNLALAFFRSGSPEGTGSTEAEEG